MPDCFGQFTIIPYPTEIKRTKMKDIWHNGRPVYLTESAQLKLGGKYFRQWFHLVELRIILQSACAIFSRGKTKMADEQVRMTFFKNCVNMSVKTVKSLITMTLWCSRAMGIMFAVWNY